MPCFPDPMKNLDSSSRKRSRNRTACVTLVALLFGNSLMLSAAQRRLLIGSVSANGRPVKGAVVKLENIRTLRMRSYITKKNGDFHFAGLNPDVDYEIWAQHGQQKSSKKSVSRFDEGDPIRVELALE
ncbi:MAG: carboxypeptidase-like regulatory domain-containing protein [Nitrospirota bacterium]